jgi:hypothetical protein
MIRRIVTLGVLGLVLALGAGLASAKGKPPKPAPEPPPAVDTGIIYWSGSHVDGVIHTMDPDGSDKTNLSLKGWPSIGQHGGERWFLVLKIVDPDNHYPYQDGETADANGDIWPFAPIQELFAVSESGTEIQLTDDPSIQPNLQLAQPFSPSSGPTRTGTASWIPSTTTGCMSSSSIRPTVSPPRRTASSRSGRSRDPSIRSVGSTSGTTGRPTGRRSSTTTGSSARSGRGGVRTRRTTGIRCC